MKTNFLVLLVLFLLFAHIAIGQKTEYPEPKIIDLVYSKHDLKYGIRYHLPDAAAKLLDSFTLPCFKKYPKGELIMEVDIMGDTMVLVGLNFKRKLKRLCKNSAFAQLVKHSNRYILSNGRRIPFYFGSDIKYGYFGFTFFDGAFFMSFIDSYSNGVKILETELWGN